jgi:hypothetical protein
MSNYIRLDPELDAWLDRDARSHGGPGKARRFEEILGEHPAGDLPAAQDTARLHLIDMIMRRDPYPRIIQLSDFCNSMLDNFRLRIPPHLRPSRDLTAAFIIFRYQERFDLKLPRQ